MNTWFAKVLCFVHIDMRGTSFSHFYNCKEGKDSPESSGGRERLEFGSVEYYDVLGAEKLPIDKIEEELNCLRVRRQRTAGKAGSFTSTKLYGFVLIDIIRGIVHIVRSTDIVNQPSFHDERRKAEQAFSTRAGDWKSHVFYVNH